MRHILNLLIAFLTVATAWAQGGSGVGYDPTNPPDPQTGYRLTVKATPENAANITPSRAMYPQEGESIYCEAYAKPGYKFRAWMVGDEVVSDQPTFNYMMPGEPVVLTAWFDKVAYDPENPGDPFLDGYTHKVSVYNSPSIGGWINNNNFLLKEGEEYTLYAYPNGSFRFSCWKKDGVIVSTDPYLNIKMGDTNLEYTAQYVYDPTNPGNPGTNSWNAATGELIIDSFDAGSLWQAIERTVGQDSYESVNSIIVTGKMDAYDLGAVRNLPQLTIVDFSRTSGYNYVPSWIFQDCKALTKVMLPASISEIQYYAFYNCTNLSELVMYAAMPPYVDEYAFTEVPANMVVKVFSGSVDLYKNAQIWSRYTIMTIDEDSTALTVMLPDDGTDGRYRNASLQLNNLSTGQSQKLLITGTRTKFIFGNLIPDMKYSLYALAPNGNVIGKHLDFMMPKEGMEYKFENLLPLRDVKLTLSAPDGTDVSATANVSWFDEKHTFLGSGNILPGQVEGYEVAYEVVLPRELAILYDAPENGVHEIAAGENVVKLTLSARKTGTISGVLTDSSTGKPIADGYITVSQIVDGLYAVSASASTDKDGKYSLKVYDIAGTISAGSPEHIEETREFAGLSDSDKFSAINAKPLYGDEITLSLISRDNILKGAADNEFISYEDYANVAFDVTNLTTGEIIETRLRYPRLILLSAVNEGDKIEVKGTPKNSAFNPATETTVMKAGKGDVKLAFTSNGDIKASYATSDADEVVALLYGEDGQLISKMNYSDRQTVFKGLPAATYSLVTMASGSLFSGAGSMRELEESRLEAGKDYVINSVKVEEGYISPVEIENVPVFDESIFYYTGPETSISVNKKSVTVGSIVTVRSKVDFLKEYEGMIDKVNVIFTIPEGCDYVDNSLLVAGSGANFTTTEDGRLSVEMYVKDASPRFCIIPRKSGEYRPSAIVEFYYNGEMIRQPIGSALFSAGDFTLSVPAKTSVTRITARGGAPALSDIKVYDNNVFIGSTRSLTNGDWRLSFDLYEPGDYSEHLIYAEITTSDGQKYNSTVAKTIYDKDWAELTDIDMIYGGTTVDFNHIDATTTPGSYSYVPGNDMFTFKTRFRSGHAAHVKNLDFIILLSDGSRKRMEGKYLPSSESWVCATGFPDVNRLPVNVKVLYVENRDTIESASLLIDNIDEPFRCPDVIPVIDPSGFVYEAVPSNRVEGVTATIFYKEYVEDMYGEVTEKSVIWDAEAYAQKNPLFTDADGMYQWDVPQGEWMVRFEKDGYETAHTDWLPVPPPQLDVNIGIYQTVMPQVTEAHAYGSSVIVEFDKYMTPATLNTSNIVVTVNGEAVDGSISLLKEEMNPEGNTYARGARFEASQPFGSSTVTLMVSNKVASYAGVRMEEAFSQEFEVEPEVTGFTVDPRINAYLEVPSKFFVTITPAEAVAGKNLLIESDAPIATIPESVEIDKNGIAIVNFTGELPGEANLSFRIEGAIFEAPASILSVTVMPDPSAEPTASVASDSQVLVGSTIELSSETEGAQIWYTVDGSDPTTSETRTLYSAPIVISNETTISAYTVAEGYLDSQVVKFHYTVPTAVAPTSSVASDSQVLVGSTIELSSETEGAQIWYTVDGSDPTTSETRTLYSAPIVISNETTIMAYTVAEGYLDSEAVKFHYTVPTAVAPTASVASDSQVLIGSTIELSSDTEYAQIWYTVDSSDPTTSETRTVYSAPIVISNETTIMAYTVAEGYLDSEAVKFNYTVPTAVAPTASVASDSQVLVGSTIELSSETEGAQIWYTVDGSDPTTSETRTVYSAPIVISNETTIMAYTVAEGYLDSETVKFNYTVPTAVAPTASVASDSQVLVGSTIELSSETEGAQIWYTIDGSDPMTSETRAVYSAPIVISNETTIMAYTVAEGYLDSETATFHYSVPTAPSPTTSIESGATLKKGTEIELISSISNAVIRYTTDGTNPATSESSHIYDSPIVMENDMTITAIVSAEGYLDSEAAVFTYYLMPTAEMPQASVPTESEIEIGSYLELFSNTPDAEIWYTTDGSDPLTSATHILYTEPILVSADMHILAVATAEGYDVSEIAEFKYVAISGVDSIVNGKLKVAATPAADGFTVTGVEGEAIVSVFDLSGKIVMAPRTIYSDETIRMSDDIPGVYIVSVVSGDRKATLKFHKR